jgi:hypothetical protein
MVGINQKAPSLILGKVIVYASTRISFEAPFQSPLTMSSSRRTPAQASTQKRLQEEETDTISLLSDHDSREFEPLLSQDQSNPN